MDPTPCVGVLRRAVAALNAGDEAGYLAAFTPDCTRTIPGAAESLSLTEVMAGMRLFASSLDGFFLEEVLMFGHGRHVCAHWRLTGVHNGGALGVPPTGARVAFESAEIYEFEGADGGLVTASWSFADTTSWFAQLGAS